MPKLSWQTSKTPVGLLAELVSQAPEDRLPVGENAFAEILERPEPFYLFSGMDYLDDAMDRAAEAFEKEGDKTTTIKAIHIAQDADHRDTGRDGIVEEGLAYAHWLAKLGDAQGALENIRELIPEGDTSEGEDQYWDNELVKIIKFVKKTDIEQFVSNKLCSNHCIFIAPLKDTCLFLVKGTVKQRFKLSVLVLVLSGNSQRPNC